MHPFSVYVPHLSPFLLAQNRSLKEDIELIGRHVLVRPNKDADEGARNIRLLTRPRSKQCRAMRKDVRHLVHCRGFLHGAALIRLDLTVYHGAPKRDSRGRLLEPALDLEPPVRALDRTSGS